MTTATPAPGHTASGAPRAWLTRLRLNPGNRQAQQDLRNAAALHRRIMTLVPDGLGDSPRARAGVLFRTEADPDGAPVLLVQTGIAPDTSRLPTGYAQGATRDMTALFDALRPGLPVRYRLLGNAVRRCGPNSTAGRWKQALTLHGADADQWWADRATTAGLILHTLRSEPAPALPAWHTREPGDRRDQHVRVAHTATLFQGAATVQDPAALRGALLSGIGRSKSYGCGLLSLAPRGPEA
jgi:CRISPR system Cascade subunit CasE